MNRALVLVTLLVAGCSKPVLTTKTTAQEAIRAVQASIDGAVEHVDAADVQVVFITEGDTNPVQRASVAHAELNAAKSDLRGATTGTTTAITAADKSDASNAAIKKELDDLKASRSAADETAWRRFRLTMVLVFALAVGGLVFWEVPGSLIPRLAISLGAAGVTSVLTWAGATWLKTYWWIAAIAVVLALGAAWIVKWYRSKQAATPPAGG